MKLVHEADVPQDRLVLLARTAGMSPFAPWIFGGIALAGGSLGVLEVASGGGCNALGFSILWTGLFSLFMLSTRTIRAASKRRTNWILAATDDGVFIKFRSYLNWNVAGDDPVVISMPWSEVAGIHQQYGFLWLTLRPGVDTSALSAALAAERERKGRSGHTYRVYPVGLIPEPPSLRIEWTGASHSRVDPPLPRVVEMLQKHVAGS